MLQGHTPRACMDVSVRWDELVTKQVSPSGGEAVLGISVSHSPLDLPLLRRLSVTVRKHLLVLHLLLTPVRVCLSAGHTRSFLLCCPFLRGLASSHPWQSVYSQASCKLLQKRLLIMASCRSFTLVSSCSLCRMENWTHLLSFVWPEVGVQDKSEEQVFFSAER